MLDHSAIFINIACSYTPFALLISHHAEGVIDYVCYGTVLILWLACLAGIWHVHNVKEERLKLQVLMTVMTFPSYPFLASYLTVTERGYAILGLLMYMIGAFIFSKQLETPVPHIFGYHEIFHVFTIAAGICSFLLIMSMIRSKDERCKHDDHGLLYDSLLWIFTSTITSKIDICSDI